MGTKNSVTLEDVNAKIIELSKHLHSMTIEATVDNAIAIKAWRQNREGDNRELIAFARRNCIWDALGEVERKIYNINPPS